jgi:hypothetical protein
MSITFVNMVARKFLLTLEQPSLQMETENEFQLPILWQSKNFSRQPCDDRNFLVTNLVTIKFFWSPFFVVTKTFWSP